MKWPLRKRQAAGYDSADLADLVIQKTEALLTRRIEDRVPGEALLPTLLATANAGDRVLDFGGAAGFHYMAASRAYPHRKFRWAIVEHPLMVERCKRFEQENLRIFASLDEAVSWLGDVDLLHSNSVMQYLDAPEAMLGRLLAMKPRFVLWARMFLAEERRKDIQVAPLSAHGPGPAPADLVDRDVNLEVVYMARAEFEAAHSAWRMVWRNADSYFFADDSTNGLVL
jgi:putative methyltransferase (TIGR04325 family)